MTSSGTPAVAVVIPAFDEATYIADTLAALQAQTFDDVVHRRVLHGFRIIVVDNNSTDGTADVVRRVASSSSVPIEVISETEPGTGCAADTGFRHAIATGAIYIARTDADTLPAPDWLSNVVAPLLDGKRLVGGRVRARSEQGTSAAMFNAVGHLWRVGHAVEWWRTRSQPDELRRSFAVVGNNLAVDAEMYERCGGFPRTSIGDVDEDQVLQQRVRAVAGARGIALRKQAVVYTSLRRLEAYGTKGFVEWYRSDDRSTIDRDADVR
ncbi:glycosyltransferase family 2 protein [Gordonia sp. OPL2]|uniref:glycosyltransferase n=1 Tax=Gordonia sp. OPL2 TaxID=2486274 RepID=UPI0016559F3C|nr:glycosyltransferase family 2 protein [Gordonia sp. OPL2]ROZ98060.1 glycosyltransferase family 2 protein [Gordonia sp. OPL2]